MRLVMRFTMILKVIEIDKNRLPDFSLLEFENKKSGMNDPLHDSGDLLPFLEDFLADPPEIDWLNLESEVNDVMRSELARQNSDFDSSSTTLSPKNKSLSTSAMKSYDDQRSLGASTVMIPVENHVAHEYETGTAINDKNKKGEEHDFSKETDQVKADTPGVLTEKIGRYRVLQAMVYHHRRKYNGNLEVPFVLSDLYAEYPEVKKIVQDGHSAIQNTLRSRNYLSQPDNKRGTGNYWLTPKGVEYAMNQGW